MSVYVGIDVHRKRSQVAVVTEDGTVQLNKNVVNGTEPLTWLIRDLPAGYAGGVGGRIRLGLAGPAAQGVRLCPASGAPAAVQGDRLGAAEERQGPARRFWRSCCARTCCPRRGSPRRTVRQLRALLRHRASLVRLGTQQRNRIHAVAADHGYDRSASYWTGPGPRLAGRAGPAAGVAGDRHRLPGGDRWPGAGDRPDRRRAAPARQGRPAGQGADRTLPGVGEFTALVMVAEIGDISRFGSARKLASWAGLTPTVRGSDLHRPARAHLQAGLGLAAVGA